MVTTRTRPGFVVWLAVILVLASLATLIAIAAWNVRERLHRNLRYAALFKIATQIEEYALQQKALPPRIRTDSKSGDEASWRVILETDAGEIELSEYRFHERWDSPSNLAFAKQVTTVSYDSQNTRTKYGLPATNFVALSEPSGAICDDHSITPIEITDGAENTILIAEILETDIAWTEPRDVTFEQFAAKSTAVRPGYGNDIGFTGQLLLFGDFKIYRLLRPLPKEYFKASWTRDLNDGISRSELIRMGFLEK